MATPPSTPRADARRTSLPLTVVGESPRLRADAERNRIRLLEVAADLVAEGGAECLTMDAVAAAAEVGKGTVFRRFGSRPGLLFALVDHQEQLFQAAFISGPPPLGPGAPALERLRAFGPATLRHERDHKDLYIAAHEDVFLRYEAPAYRLRTAHLAMLLREAGTEGDFELLAHTLLGYLETPLVRHLLTDRGMSAERLEAGWHALVDRLVGAA
ncbi:TetR/AcrR family transcriptional regulator [Nocardiopsis aegyptia]|uniref:AcrR family transcriptional regulator n=1 Tax=Nocardiopsis aegyptia TaxID=220378 RepID=A0A7Z0EJE7_9ACTN|nr:TetR/AcrR family transcriptional regulator [Nocardiopsis aegyptia]NYJ32706.1 AcrR family transcriptional regulator [Nocardiopsis aegyptia]